MQACLWLYIELKVDSKKITAHSALHCPPKHDRWHVAVDPPKKEPSKTESSLGKSSEARRWHRTGHRKLAKSTVHAAKRKEIG